MPRGSKPGEHRGGRQKGTSNKINAPIKAYAATFDNEAIDGIVAVARNPNTPAATVVMAWMSIMDRGHGRPPQALTDGEGGPLTPLVVNHNLILESSKG